MENVDIAGDKIRPRYFIIEVLSGLVFLLFAISLKADIFNLPLELIIYFWFYIIFFCSLFIIAGIDKERSTIQKSVLLFSIIVAICYMIYVCIMKHTSIYTYIISLTGIAVLLVLDSVFLQKKLSENYVINILILSMVMIIFSGQEVFYYTVVLSLFIIGIKLCIIRIKNISKKKSVINTNNNEIDISIAFILSISNIFMIIVSNLLR